MNLGSYAITANAFSATSTGNTLFYGNVYCNSASLFTVPIGANPTLTSGGQIAVDSTTTSGSALRFYSNAEYCLPAYWCENYLLYAPAATGTFHIWRVPYNVTFRDVNFLCRGGTSVTGGLYEADGAGINLVAMTSAIVITAASGNTTSAIVNAGADAGDYIAWVHTARGGAVTSLAINISYTIDSNV